jgi:hypothetical protein
MPARELTDEEAESARNGRPVDSEDVASAGPVRLMHDGSLAAIADVQDNALRPKVVLPS